MSIHQERTHPVPVEGCGPCRWASIQVTPSATPTRGKGHISETKKFARKQEKDLNAYARLVKDGVQPARTVGAAFAEAHANTRHEIEADKVYDDVKFAERVQKTVDDLAAG